LLFLLVVQSGLFGIPGHQGLSSEFIGTDIQFRYKPVTGTFHDLCITHNGQTFWPSYFGGILSFVLGEDLFRVWEGQHRSEVLSIEELPNGYRAKFRWSYNRDSFDFTIEVLFNGRTLAISYLTAPGCENVIKFGLDRTESTLDPKIIEVPYGENVLYTNGLFVSALLDLEKSNASRIYSEHQQYSDTSVYFSQLAVYLKKTNGRRNSLKETIYLTISPEINDTFLPLDNPISPYKQEFSNKIILDLWRDSFLDYKRDIEPLMALGWSDLFVIIHRWQKYGYDNGLPTAFPAGEFFGGPSDLNQVLDLCKRYGLWLAFHTNYVDFYPNSDDWDEQDIALNEEGLFMESWYNGLLKIQSYLLKPSRALKYARVYEKAIHEAYGTNAGFLDVHSAVLPSYKVDYDASVPNAGKQSATLSHYRNLLTRARAFHNGPVIGEGYGFSMRLWAGYADALEADPRQIFFLRRDERATKVPSLVDYKLKILHPHFTGFGMGWLLRFFRDDGVYTEEEMGRYRATELAFGNAGFIDNPVKQNVPMIEVLREYCFMKNIQKYYLNTMPDKIYYSVDNQLLEISAALHKVLPGIEGVNTNAGLSEEMGLLKIIYLNGFVLYVNRTEGRTWDVFEKGRVYTLSPGGFLAFMGDEFLAYTALENGVKSHYVWPAEISCQGHLNDFIYAPDNIAGRKVINRGLARLEYINALSWQPNPENRDIVKYKIFAKYGLQRSLLAELDGTVTQYLHRFVSKETTYEYVILAVNSEGREGTAASIVVH
jgi:hypothetical protein